MNRDDFKHNFLKEISVKIEYEGVTERDIEEYVLDIRKILKGNQYTRCFSKEDFLKDADEKNDNVNLEALSEYGGYLFCQENADGMRLHIASRYIELYVKKEKYINFLEYVEPFIRAVHMIKEKSDFFHMRDLYIRKVNYCFLSNLQNLHNYFTEKYFNLLSGALDKRCAFYARDRYQSDKYICDVRRSIDYGRRSDGYVNRVLMLSEIHMVEEKEKDTFLNGEEGGRRCLERINEKLFELYCDALTKTFMNKLSQENFNDKEVEGVTPN